MIDIFPLHWNSPSRRLRLVRRAGVFSVLTGALVFVPALSNSILVGKAATGITRASSPPKTGTFVVTTSSDSADKCVVNRSAGASTREPSLRCAITTSAADTFDTAKRIAFDISPSDRGCPLLVIQGTSVHVCRILPTTNLPPLGKNTTIDGTTQRGARANSSNIGDNAIFTVILDGSLDGGAAPRPMGLSVPGSRDTLRGLEIVNFFNGHSRQGIEVSGGAGDVIGGRFML